jgi:alkanesulfonate monooxygenase SsuD/methylene tetrahydromethanopterin reductase-like flavin-dependent oxidoreductase (luciferase family)
MNTCVLFAPVFDVLCDANGWDKKVAARVREALAKIDGVPKAGTLGDENTSREVSALRAIRDIYPPEWVREGCAVGSAAACAPLLQERLDAGADGILFHGTAPDDLGPLLDAWRNQRPAARFENRSANPGL